MKVKEERILADRRLMKTGGQVGQLLAACWEETLDPGPYALGEGPLAWHQVLQGDRFYALLHLRVLTYGPEYAFSIPCAQEVCRATIAWELNLDTLPVRPLSEESRAIFQRDNRFATTLPEAGLRVWFRLLTGADEEKLPALRRRAPDRLLSAMLAFRVVEIEGVASRDKTRTLEDLSLRDADALMRAFEAVECGVETALEVECPECFAVQEVELPFGRGFLMPGQGPTTRPTQGRPDPSTSFPA